VVPPFSQSSIVKLTDVRCLGLGPKSASIQRERYVRQLSSRKRRRGRTKSVKRGSGWEGQGKGRGVVGEGGEGEGCRGYGGAEG